MYNDETCNRSVGWPAEAIQDGFYEDFDSCSGGSDFGGFPSGDLRLFEIGAPNNGSISAPKSSPNVVMTGLDFNYFSGKEEYYNLPRFVGFDTIAGAQIRFSHRFNMGAGDAITFEYFAGGQWNILGYPGTKLCSENW